jgi:ribosomal protein S18 acetylase RimI-like enzyme
MISIEKATTKESEDFVELFLISDPFFYLLFGQKTKPMLNNLFKTRENLFSFEHVFFSKIEENISGMIISYDWKSKNKENLRTGYLMLKNLGITFVKVLPILLKLNQTVGKVIKGEFYISNIAVYAPYRSLGIGKQLIFKAEEEARKLKSLKIVLDAEKENTIAIKFYKKIGYEKTSESTLELSRQHKLSFFRMEKVL